jgi:hypothetical protein
MGGPGIPKWNPDAQRAIVAILTESGADPNAAAAGGVTPLHRAVRNCCASAVTELLLRGADASRRTDRGSTALDLARRTTGRGGSGSAGAKEQRARIVALLEAATSNRASE